MKTNEQNIVAFVRNTNKQTVIVIANVGQTVDNLEITLPNEILTIGEFEFVSILDSSQFPGFEIISTDSDYKYQFNSQLPAGKFFLFELKKH